PRWVSHRVVGADMALTLGRGTDNSPTPCPGGHYAGPTTWGGGQMHESARRPAELGVLPDPVQLRAAAIAADALGEMPAAHVPVTLRRVAVFAPSRRAKLAGMQVLTAAADDPDFREHLAVQVRASHPDELKLI